MPERWRGIPKEVLQGIFTKWAYVGYTLDSVHIEKQPKFDPSAPYVPQAYGWKFVNDSQGTEWGYVLFPDRIPPGRGNRSMRAYRKEMKKLAAEEQWKKAPPPDIW